MISHLYCCFGVPVNSFEQCLRRFCIIGPPIVPEMSLHHHWNCSRYSGLHSFSLCALFLGCNSSICLLYLSKIVDVSFFSLMMIGLSSDPLGYSCSCEYRYHLFFVIKSRYCCFFGSSFGLAQSQKCLGLHLCIFGHVQCCFVISETRQALLPSKWTFSFYNSFSVVVIKIRYCYQFSLIYCSPRSSYLASAGKTNLLFWRSSHDGWHHIHHLKTTRYYHFVNSGMCLCTVCFTETHHFLLCHLKFLCLFFRLTNFQLPLH